MSTPFGKRGHFYQEWSEGEEWERIQIKADDCPRISKEFLESERPLIVASKEGKETILDLFTKVQLSLLSSISLGLGERIANGKIST